MECAASSSLPGTGADVINLVDLTSPSKATCSGAAATASRDPDLPPTAAAAGPSSNLVDLCTEPDVEAGNTSGAGTEAATESREVIDLLTDSDADPEGQMGKAPTPTLHPLSQQQQKKKRMPQRGHGAVPRLPSMPLAVKNEPVVLAATAAAAIKQEQLAAWPDMHAAAVAAAAAGLLTAVRAPSQSLPAVLPSSGSMSEADGGSGGGGDGGGDGAASKRAGVKGSELEAESASSSAATSRRSSEQGASQAQSGSQGQELPRPEQEREPLRPEMVDRAGVEQAMDWEASPALAAPSATPKDGSGREAAPGAVEAGLGGESYSGAADGGATALSLPGTEVADEQIGSLPTTLEVDGSSAGSGHSSGSPWATSEPAGSEEQVMGAAEASYEAQQPASAASPAGLMVAEDGGEEQQAQLAVADTVEALVAACQAQQSLAPTQPQQRPPLLPDKFRLASPFSPALRHLAEPVAKRARQQQQRTSVSGSAPPAAAAAAAAAAGHYAVGSAAGGQPASAMAAGVAAGLAPHLGAKGAADPADGMPDTTDTAAMLQWLRSRIPAQLLDQYGEPHVVSDEEHAIALQRLEAYEQEIKRVQRSGKVQGKFDLSAASQLPALYPEWGLWEKTYGHKPGVRLGQRFKGRGWLQALGVHINYYSGIMHEKEAPAYAICLSGGYEDDDDHGDWLWYTGQGGRDGANGTQGRDQEWTRGNAAIRACMEQGKPLRVCRGKHVDQEEYDARKQQTKVVKKLEYTYDGLYYVVKADRMVGRGGKSLVCKFLLVGIPGHYKASKSVSFIALRGFRDRVRLAAGVEDSDEEDEEEEEEEKGQGEDEEEQPWGYMAGRHKRQRTQAATATNRALSAAAAAAAEGPSKARRKKQVTKEAPGIHSLLVPLKQDAAWLAAQKRRPGFLCADISGGVEKYQIPVFNEVDDEPPPQLTYVRRSVVGGPQAQQMIDDGLRVMPSSWCGLEMGASSGAYMSSGLMRYTRSEGHWECSPDCRKRHKCRNNRFVSERGLCLPLEIFRTRGKGWGVRCARNIPGGAFICSYEGLILSHDEAEAQQGTDGDSYYFDLDHFVLLYEDPSCSAQQRQRLAALPFEVVPGNTDVETLVIDAANTGNLARFINHSCDPNLVVQPVLRQGDSGVRYTVGIFASRDIPRGTELCYNYQYKVGTVQGKEMECQCGAKNCKGRLL